MKSASAILVLFFLTFFIQPIQAQEKSAEGPFDQLIIRGVTLINGNGAPPMGPVDVVVEQNVIPKCVLWVIQGLQLTMNEGQN